VSQDWRKRWTGKWALITGASAGIGWALADHLASAGVNLVLTARRVGRLEELAREATAKGSPKTEIVISDLAQPGASRELRAAVAAKGIEIELLINNAGFGAFGYTQEIPEASLTDMIQVNCTAVADLTRLYLPEMVARRHGDILIVSSVAAFQPVPFNSAYAATKAFDLLFAEGVAEEVREFGVNVCALCPGSTDTEFAQVAHQPHRTFRVSETAEKVARVGLEAIAQGKSSVISGRRNWMMVQAERLAPRRFVAAKAAKMMSPKKHRE
jgi:short-subunit dehydrogenase